MPPGYPCSTSTDRICVCGTRAGPRRTPALVKRDADSALAMSRHPTSAISATPERIAYGRVWTRAVRFRHFNLETMGPASRALTNQASRSGDLCFEAS